MTMAPRLLLVDDDVDLVEMMREYLEPEGFQVNIAHNGTMFRAAEPETVDLVILDVMLPGQSGFDLLRDFRKVSDVPVIMLTAKDSDIDRVVGLEIGADDYVSKPFNPRVLVARIRAVLRRTSQDAAAPRSASSPSMIIVGDVELDPTCRQAWCRRAELDLTSAEFSLLEALLLRVGQVTSRDDLSQAAFGRQSGAKIDRNVDGLISKLRRKIDPDGDVETRIKTVRNAGYIYAQSLDTGR